MWLWDVNTGECLYTLQGHANKVRTVAFSRQGNILASGSDDQTVRLWDVCTGQCLQILQGHTNQIRSVGFSPDGQIVASVSDDQTVKLWNVPDGKCLQTLHGHTKSVWSVHWSPVRVSVTRSDSDSAALASLRASERASAVATLKSVSVLR